MIGRDPYKPSITGMSLEEVLSTVPAGLREPFLQWWGNRPTFSHQLDMQKIVVEAYREEAAQAATDLSVCTVQEPVVVAPHPPTADEIVEVLQQFPRLAREVKNRLFKAHVEEMEANPDTWMEDAKREFRNA